MRYKITAICFPQQKKKPKITYLDLSLLAELGYFSFSKFCFNKNIIWDKKLSEETFFTSFY